MSELHIRPERPGDEDAIHALTARACETIPFTSGTHRAFIGGLRGSGNVALSLGAEQDGRVVGHIAFSPVRIGDVSSGWFGLGPISVLPELQKRGIGKLLIREGLDRLKERNAKGCALIGDPDVYRSSGFTSDGALVYEGVDAKYVQWIAFSAEKPSGHLTFARAFDVKTP